MNRDIMNVIFGGMSVAPPKKVWIFRVRNGPGGSMARYLWEMLERIPMKGSCQLRGFRNPAFTRENMWVSYLPLF